MEPILDIDQPTYIIKPRKGFIAFLLSLVLPGLGQIYNGQPKKAIIFFGLLLFIPLLFGLSRGTTFFYGLLTFAAVMLTLRIYILVDAVRNARRQKKYILKAYNTWYYHLIIAAGMLGVLIIYDLNSVLGTQSFQIPTSSGNPTIQVGDWLVADMRAYNNKKPDYGDLVLFSGSDGELYFFRIVGKPNDIVDLTNNIAGINGKPGKSRFIREAFSLEGSFMEFEEKLPNGHKHRIYNLQDPPDSANANIKNITVPPDSYYLLGDNRSWSADSRYVGFIHKDSIKGQIAYSYWGANGFSRMNVDFR